MQTASCLIIPHIVSGVPVFPRVVFSGACHPVRCLGECPVPESPGGGDTVADQHSARSVAQHIICHTASPRRRVLPLTALLQFNIGRDQASCHSGANNKKNKACLRIHCRIPFLGTQGLSLSAARLTPGAVSACFSDRSHYHWFETSGFVSTHHR